MWFNNLKGDKNSAEHIWQMWYWNEIEISEFNEVNETSVLNVCLTEKIIVKIFINSSNFLMLIFDCVLYQTKTEFRKQEGNKSMRFDLLYWFWHCRKRWAKFNALLYKQIFSMLQVNVEFKKSIFRAIDIGLTGFASVATSWSFAAEVDVAIVVFCLAGSCLIVFCLTTFCLTISIKWTMQILTNSEFF